MDLTIPLHRIYGMYLSLRGFLIFCFSIFLLTLIIVYWDVLQQGNYAKSLGLQSIAFLAMIVMGAFAVWKFRNS